MQNHAFAISLSYGKKWKAMVFLLRAIFLGHGNTSYELVSSFFEIYAIYPLFKLKVCEISKNNLKSLLYAS